MDGRSGIAASGLSNFHAGVDSAVLRSSAVANPPASQRSNTYSDAYSSGPVDAAVGIRNGLLLGAAFWVVAFSIFSLVRYFA